MQKAILRCIGWFCSMLLVLAVVLPAAAQTTIIINNVNVTCASADVTYTIDGEIAQGAVLVSAFVGESLVGSTSGDTIGGTHTVNVAYPLQTNGTLIAFRVTDDVTMGTANAVCEGSEPPPVENPPPDESSEESAPPPWEGYSDGRLNPDRGEYYTVYCLNGFLSIWRSVPVDEEIKRIAIANLQSIAIAGELDLGDNMTLVRNTSSTVTIYGSNGNLAPEAGSKAFGYEACLMADFSSGTASSSALTNTNQENSQASEECMQEIGGYYYPVEECVDAFSPMRFLGLCTQGIAIIPTIVLSFGLFRRKRRSARIAQ